MPKLITSRTRSTYVPTTPATRLVAAMGDERSRLQDAISSDGKTIIVDGDVVELRLWRIDDEFVERDIAYSPKAPSFVALAWPAMVLRCLPPDQPYDMTARLIAVQMDSTHMWPGGQWASFMEQAGLARHDYWLSDRKREEWEDHRLRYQTKRVEQINKTAAKKPVPPRRWPNFKPDRSR